LVKLKADRSIFLVEPLPYPGSDGRSEPFDPQWRVTRTTILAATPALAMIVVTAPTFAASDTNSGTQAQSHNSFTNNSNQARQCAEAGSDCTPGF
jgi:hypothetical protein